MAEPGPPRLLIVEDEAMVLALLRRGAEAAGWAVAATASSVADALARLDAAPGWIEGALLDANLRGVEAAPVAARLREAGIPFIVVTGYAAEHVARFAGDAPVLRKPFRAAKLAEALAALQRR
jgi:Response regulators consisting of a CheY-like receiver domain and a winged-helix DNA-binding domain